MYCGRAQGRKPTLTKCVIIGWEIYQLTSQSLWIKPIIQKNCYNFGTRILWSPREWSPSGSILGIVALNALTQRDRSLLLAKQDQELRVCVKWKQWANSSPPRRECFCISYGNVVCDVTSWILLVHEAKCESWNQRLTPYRHDVSIQITILIIIFIF